MYLRTDKIGPGAWRQKRSAPIIPYLSGDFTGKFPLCIHGEIRSEPYRPPKGKIPIYELSDKSIFCHNNLRGEIIMAKSINRYISDLLGAYQEATRKTCTEMALDFDITLSNLYLYRNGKGNPRA